MGNTMMTLAQLKRQDAQNDRANRLSDLQYRQLQEEEDYRKGLRGAMSDPRTTRTASVIPSSPQLDPMGIPGQSYMPPPDTAMIGADRGNVGSLRELGLMSPAPTSPYQPNVNQASPLVQAYNEGRIKTDVKTQTPTQAGAEYALKKGRVKDAAELINVDDALAQYAAKVQSGQGDATEFYKRKNDLDTYKTFVSEVAPLLKTPQGRQMAQTIAQKYKELHPDKAQTYDLGTIQAKGGVIINSLYDENGASAGRLITLEDGSTHLQPPEKDTKGFDTVDLGDKVEIIPRDGSPSYTKPKGAAPKAPGAEKPDPIDAIVAREAVKDLPKLRREARTAEATKPRIAQMVQLMDKGSAGGLKGNALAAVSGIFDVPATSEAELFKKLASAGAGQLRASVIGPGQVSNYEQTLLQSVSGGGNGARTAIKQLLKYYEQEADRTIGNYNDAVDSAATVAPKVTKGFGKVGSGGGKKDPLGILN